MSWLLVAILAYFVLSIVALVDKYLLVGPIPNPGVYAFYVGGLGILALFLIPFVDFSVPPLSSLVLALTAGAIYVFALFGFYTGLRRFEASRVVPAIGGLLPLFTFGLVYLFSAGKETLEGKEILAFILLIAGSVLVAFEKDKSATSKSLQISAITAFLFSLSFVLGKFVYQAQLFWPAFIWMRIGGFLAALLFLFSKDVREELLRKKVSFKPEIGIVFFLNQALGGGAFLLQNWAVALVPLHLLAFVNALESTKYVFLLALATLISLKFPQILKEEISKQILFQKLFAVLLIGLGLLLLTLY